MTRAVVFVTPGLIDIRAFTHFGVNSKPNSTNPIGYFGTGLKYAIAVLVREGMRPVVWIGNTQYTFFPKESKFRDKDFTFIRMKKVDHSLMGKLKPYYLDLPFTTELGKNWELWQAFRELESNTRDEGGLTRMQGEYPVLHTAHETKIIVEGEKFAKVYENINEVFLDPSLEIGWANHEIQIINRGSEYVYYRGLRVLKLEKPTKHTYNLLGSQTLTEDRTLMYPHVVEQEVGRFVTLTNDEKLIRKTIEKDDKHWEGAIRWNYVYHTPGETFMSVVQAAPTKGWSVAPAAHGYYSGYAPSLKRDPFKNFPRPWDVEIGGPNNEEERSNQIVDANGKIIFDSLSSDHRCMEYEADEYGGTWSDIGTAELFRKIVELVNEQS